MKLKIEKTNVINDVSTWFRFAEPEGGAAQWKAGRSAMEFARYMTTAKPGQMPDEIEQYLNGIGFNVCQFICYPEEVTSFDGYNLGKGSGRHHDGLLVSDNCLVGIEAKVSESFDKSISKKIEGAKSNSDDGENMRDRIVNSLKLIKPDFDKVSLSDEKIGSLMYQLVSGTVGTIIEADKRNISKASFLIIEFVGDVERETNYKSKVEDNQKAYDNFLEFLGLSGKEDSERYLNINLKDKTIQIWFAKIQISITRDFYKYKKTQQ